MNEDYNLIKSTCSINLSESTKYKEYLDIRGFHEIIRKMDYDSLKNAEEKAEGFLKKILEDNKDFNTELLSRGDELKKLNSQFIIQDTYNSAYNIFYNEGFNEVEIQAKLMSYCNPLTITTPNLVRFTFPDQQKVFQYEIVKELLSVLSTARHKLEFHNKDEIKLTIKDKDGNLIYSKTTQAQDLWINSKNPNFGETVEVRINSSAKKYYQYVYKPQKGYFIPSMNSYLGQEFSPLVGKKITSQIRVLKQDIKKLNGSYNCNNGEINTDTNGKTNSNLTLEEVEFLSELGSLFSGCSDLFESQYIETEEIELILEMEILER